MRLEFLGHSCFRFEAEGCPSLLIDPYHPKIGYSEVAVGADLTLISHEHFDHNYVEGVWGATQVLRGATKKHQGELLIEGFLAEHGGGDEDDYVVCYRLTFPGVRVGYLSDIDDLSTDLRSQFKDLDLLLLACGGVVSMGGDQGAVFAKELNPRFVVPMHCKTPFLDLSKCPMTDTPEVFCRHFQRDEVHNLRGGILEWREWRGRSLADSVQVLKMESIR